MDNEETIPKDIIVDDVNNGLRIDFKSFFIMTKVNEFVIHFGFTGLSPEVQESFVKGFAKWCYDKDHHDFINIEYGETKSIRNLSLHSLKFHNHNYKDLLNNLLDYCSIKNKDELYKRLKF